MQYFIRVEYKRSHFFTTKDLETPEHTQIVYASLRRNYTPAKGYSLKVYTHETTCKNSIVHLSNNPGPRFLLDFDGEIKIRECKTTLGGRLWHLTEDLKKTLCGLSVLNGTIRDDWEDRGELPDQVCLNCDKIKKLYNCSFNKG